MGMQARRGFTLVEVIVVLVVMSIAVAVVGVAFVPRRPDDLEQLEALVQYARSTAVRRAETMRLDVAPSGAWVLRGSTAGGDSVASGRVKRGLKERITVLFSAFGTCAPDLRSELAATPLPLDPTACALRVAR
jgi:prepilin-type N-terminal cleavage/methylation domain-containing protein